MGDILTQQISWLSADEMLVFVDLPDRIRLKEFHWEIIQSGRTMYAYR
jgi:hypothetical protein